MANIQEELKRFKEAEYGEDVRDSLISSITKINSEVEGNTNDTAEFIQQVEQKIQEQDAAIEQATQEQEERITEVIAEQTKRVTDTIVAQTKKVDNKIDEFEGIRQGLLDAKTNAEKATTATQEALEAAETATQEALEAAETARKETEKIGNINEVLEEYEYRVFVQKDGEKKPMNVCFNVTEDIELPTSDNVKAGPNMGLKIIEE